MHRAAVRGSSLIRRGRELAIPAGPPAGNRCSFRQLRISSQRCIGGTPRERPYICNSSLLLLESNCFIPFFILLGQRFGNKWLVFGCIGTYFCKQTCVLQHLLRSTELRFGKAWQNWQQFADVHKEMLFLKRYYLR